MWWGCVETRPWPRGHHLSEPAPLYLHEPIGRQYQHTLTFEATTDEYWHTYAALRLRFVRISAALYPPELEAWRGFGSR